MPHLPCPPRCNPRPRAAALLASLVLAGCASPPIGPTFAGSGVCRAPAPNPRAAYNRPYKVLGRAYTPLSSASGYDVEGTASWYGWESGSTTSMGAAFNPRAFTAASRDLPLPTCVQVTNLRNGQSAVVLVNDRGPFVDGRVMDLSFGAAKAIGVTRTGTARVRIVALAPGGAAAVSDVPGIAPVPQAPANGLAEPLAPTPVPAPDASAAAAPVLAPGIDEQPLAPMPQAAPVAPASAPSPDGVPAMPNPDSLTDLIARVDAPSVVAPQSSDPASTYLQLGAFSVEANARAQGQRLEAAGISPVLVVPGLSRGQPVYRVEIGPLADPGSPALAQRLRALGLTSHTVVQR